MEMDSKRLEACTLLRECYLWSCHKIFKTHPYMKLKLLLINTLKTANPKPSVLTIVLCSFLMLEPDKLCGQFSAQGETGWAIVMSLPLPHANRMSVSNKLMSDFIKTLVHWSSLWRSDGWCNCFPHIYSYWQPLL